MDINVSENLNIDDYEISELVNMFGLSFPLTAEKVLSKLNTYIQRFIEQANPALVTFLEQARYKLIKSMNPDEDDETDAEQVLADEYWSNDKDKDIPNRKDSTRIVSQQPYSIQQRERLNIPQQHAVEIVQGQLNPFLGCGGNNTVEKLVNIDSQFREIIDNSGNDLCAPPDIPGGSTWKGQVTKTNVGVDSPSDYTIDLSEPLTNVVSLKLNDLQLNRSWYIFASAYGTNTFWVTNAGGLGQEEQYYIKSGNWSASVDADIGLFAPFSLGVWGALNNMQGYGASLNGVLNFTFDQVSHKTTIENNSAADITITFVGPTVKPEPASFDTGVPPRPNKFINNCDDGSGSGNGGGGIESGTTPDGGKRDYNLGWLLGFREKSYTIATGDSIIGEALIDTFGSRYVYIMFDDYNKNRLTYNLLGTTNNKDNFKLPSYYNKNTMTNDCSGNQLVKAKTRPCRKGTAAEEEFFPIDNLTKAQQFTANSIIEAQESKKIDRYVSPTTANILAKIPIINAIERGNIDAAGVTISPMFGIIPFSRDIVAHNERCYFGPVTIKRLHIQLLDDKGNLVNLNGMDWSFSVKVKQLYQF